MEGSERGHQVENIAICPLAIIYDAGKSWVLMFFYVSPKPSSTAVLWKELQASTLEAPWSFIGDFNATLYGNERSLGGGMSASFLGLVHKKSLIDLGFTSHEVMVPL